jgi:hypothetical protein
MAFWEDLLTDALEIPLPGDAWLRGTQVSAAIAQDPGQPNRQSTRHRSRVELSTIGYVCEAAFAAWLQVPYDYPAGDWHAPDVGGYEVKGTCWHSLTGMINWHGGNYWVPEHTRAERVVCLSLFDQSRRVRAYLDGWQDMTEVRRRAERRTGKGGRGVSYLLPYRALRSWRTLERRPLPGFEDPGALRRAAQVAADERSRAYGIWDRRPRWD